MIIDLDWREFNIEDFGATVKVRPMSYAMNQRMMAFAQAGMEIDGEDVEAQQRNMGLKMVSSTEFPEFISSVLKECAKDLAGIDVKIDGAVRPAAIDDLVQYAPFLPVTMSIFNQISTISNLTEADRTALKKTLPG
jgi:hypothetical protein